MKSNIKTHSFESTYDFESYKAFLRALVGSRAVRSGLRSKFARALNCQPTFISQVLYSQAHFSLEQGEIISNFLGHSQDEKAYFLLLIQYERAGTEGLKRFFLDQMHELRRKRMVLTERLGEKALLSESNQATYYSSWQYAAIHVALTVPSLQSVAALSEYFRISKARVSSVLEFLCRVNLARQHGATFSTGDVQIRLGNNSPNIVKHHANWRNHCISALEAESIRDLHYSGVVSLSEKDAIKIKDQTLRFIQESLKTIRSSREESVYCFTIDFFGLGQT